MFKKMKTTIIVGIASLALLAPAALIPSLAYACDATISGSLSTGVNDAATGGNQSCASTTTGTTGVTTGIKTIAGDAVNIFSIIVGVVSVIMIIYGGFRYVTSGGDSGKVGNAKNTLIYAIIGLVIVALAQLIVHYVLDTASSISTSSN